MAPESDHVLVRRAAGGDQSAFEQLVRAHQDRVFTLVRGIVRSPEDAADVTQEVFIALVQHLDQFEGRAQFSTWLYRVAVRKAYDFLRKRIAVPTELPEQPAPGDGFEQHLQRAALEAAIARLDESFRPALLLVDVLGCSIEEAAGMLDVPVGTIKSRLFRARAAVARGLGTSLGREPSEGGKSTP